MNTYDCAIQLARNVRDFVANNRGTRRDVEAIEVTMPPQLFDLILADLQKRMEDMPRKAIPRHAETIIILGVRYKRGSA